MESETLKTSDSNATEIKVNQNKKDMNKIEQSIKRKIFVTYYSDDINDDFNTIKKDKNSQVEIQLNSKDKTVKYDIEKKEIKTSNYEKVWDKILYQMLRTDDKIENIKMNQLIKFFQTILIENGYKDSDQFKYLSYFKTEKRMNDLVSKFANSDLKENLVKASKKDFSIQIKTDTKDSFCQANPGDFKSTKKNEKKEKTKKVSLDEFNKKKSDPKDNKIYVSIDTSNNDKYAKAIIQEKENKENKESEENKAQTEAKEEVITPELSINVIENKDDTSEISDEASTVRETVIDKTEVQDLDENNESQNLNKYAQPKIDVVPDIDTCSLSSQSDTDELEFKKVEKKKNKRVENIIAKKQLLSKKASENDEIIVQEVQNPLENKFELLSSGDTTTDSESESSTSQRKPKRSLISTSKQRKRLSKQKQIEEQKAFLEIKEGNILDSFKLRLTAQSDSDSDIESNLIKSTPKEEKKVTTESLRLFSVQEFPLLDNVHSTELHEKIARELNEQAPLDWKQIILDKTEISMFEKNKLIKNINSKPQDEVLKSRLAISNKYCKELSLSPYLPYRNEHMVMNNQDLEPINCKRCDGDTHDSHVFHKFTVQENLKPEAFIPLYSMTLGCAAGVDPKLPIKTPLSVHIGMIPYTRKQTPTSKLEHGYLRCYITNNALTYIFNDNHVQTLYLMDQTPQGAMLPFESNAYMIVGKKTLDTLEDSHERTLYVRINDTFNIRDKKYDSRKLYSYLLEFLTSCKKGYSWELETSKKINNAAYDLKNYLAGSKNAPNTELQKAIFKLFSTYKIFKPEDPIENKLKLLNRVFDTLGKLGNNQQQEFVKCIEYSMRNKKGKKGTKGSGLLTAADNTSDITCKCRILSGNKEKLTGLDEIIYHPCMLHAAAYGSGYLPNSTDVTKSKANLCGSCHARYLAPHLASLCFARCMIEKAYIRQETELFKVRQAKKELTETKK